MARRSIASLKQYQFKKGGGRVGKVAVAPRARKKKGR